MQRAFVKTAGGERLPVDIDVSVMVNDDCRKEGVGFTYHRIDGFAPIFATVGRLGYQLANELRLGNQHSQKEFPAFFRRCIGLVRRFHDGRIFVRLDSAHDADDTLSAGFGLDDEIRREVEGSGLDFIVKRNARHEDERTWIEQANGEHCEPAYSYVDEKDGRVDVFHSELKTDMDVERLPSGDYRTNSLILSLSTLAFNVLRRIGQTARQVETEGGEKRRSGSACARSS